MKSTHRADVATVQADIDRFAVAARWAAILLLAGFWALMWWLFW